MTGKTHMGGSAHPRSARLADPKFETLISVLEGAR